MACNQWLSNLYVWNCCYLPLSTQELAASYRKSTCLLSHLCSLGMPLWLFGYVCPLIYSLHVCKSLPLLLFAGLAVTARSEGTTLCPWVWVRNEPNVLRPLMVANWISSCFLARVWTQQRGQPPAQLSSAKMSAHLTPCSIPKEAHNFHMRRRRQCRQCYWQSMCSTGTVYPQFSHIKQSCHTIMAATDARWQTNRVLAIVAAYIIGNVILYNI